MTGPAHPAQREFPTVPAGKAVASAGAVIIAVALLGFVALTPLAEAAEAVRTEAIFNDPTGGDTAKNRIFARLVALINGAQTGSTIRAAFYYADATAVPSALVAAKRRGVKVQVIADEALSAHTAAYRLLSKGLGSDVDEDSFLTTCPANRGCIARMADWSIMHNKFYLFTKTLGVSNVVVQTSANLSGTGGRDGGTGWNDALEITGNTRLFNSYTGYFADLKAKRVNNNYYESRVPLQAGATKVFFYPRAGGSVSGDPAENPVMSILNSTDCFGSRIVGTSTRHRTIIRVTMMAIGLEYLASKLVSMDASGCDVRVNVRVDPTNAAQVSAVNLLLDKTTGGYQGVLVRYYCTSDPVWIHSKTFSIEGKINEKPDRRIVWTGSHNWTGGSLRGSDETMLQLEDGAAFEAYRRQYEAVAEAATHKPANGDRLSCQGRGASTRGRQR